MNKITCSATKTIFEEIIFNNELNEKKTLFGGRTLEILDKNAGLAAYKLVNIPIATASYDNLYFLKPMKVGQGLKAVSFVTGTRGRSIEVFTKFITEDLHTKEKELAFTSFCTLVTLPGDSDFELPEVIAETEEEKALMAGFEQRYLSRKDERSKLPEFLKNIDI
ncbi:acyl-CoA thioesterase [Lactobacillus terrae]|uniref:acyl-CoA thioesterase n=1 Tax=Lactobacillus terrae TaxID=2269374 RepID=UPI000C1B702A|nr:acyl-CoA thioesterase [Lactobacillus terrae]